MPSLKEVRKRIASVKSTQKITRAMKLVAAAKLRRAQDGIVAARPFANALRDVVAQLAANLEGGGSEVAHPFLAATAMRRPAVIVLTSDRGLCGGFNSNACRTAQRLIQDGTRAAEGGAPAWDGYQLLAVGRKGRDYFKRRKLDPAAAFAAPTSATATELAHDLALAASEAFLAGQVDGCKLVYNEFRSAVSQRVVVEQLLPIERLELPAGVPAADFACEPSLDEVLASLLPQYLQSRIHRALLESIASEFGARMTAMENATKNAKDMIERLSLEYNRARQASITKELMEIVGGAEALKG